MTPAEIKRREWEQRHMTDDELVRLIGNLSEKECLEKAEISLYGNGTLTAIPPEIKRFKNLKVLHVQGNSITYSNVSKELGELVHLEKIYFASTLLGNPLRYIPTPIFNLKNLTTITLAKCKLTYVHADIGKLVNLETLFLDENSISTLPSEMVRLKKLDYFALSKNKLPKQFMKEVRTFEATQLLLKKIREYYSPKEDKVKNIVIRDMVLLKKILHKDIVPLIGKLLWKTRQNQSWNRIKN